VRPFSEHEVPLLTSPTGLGHLKKYAASDEGQAHKTFYDQKIASISQVQALLNGQASDRDKQGYFARSTDLWVSTKDFAVETLPGAITVGPFIGGARPGVDDFHVGAWLARIASVVGAKKSEEGIGALEDAFGPLPDKVKAYWNAWIKRESWVNAYPDQALH
jgi:hypothetical protein